ncbi:MAG: OmpH family outer membrane protein [Spirochaetales bacterium]|jgi:outer membrane protein|nr:OmpH family outer membrane protein [Spirochaetales bacterium]
MKVRYIVFITLCLCAAFPLSPEQLTTVGIVDVTRVSTAFFRDSRAVIELEELTRRLQSEIDGITAEINQLKDRKLQAESSGDQSLALRLDEEIYKKTNYLRDYFRVRNTQLQERKNHLAESSAFLSQLQQAIAFIAEDQGYNVIIKSSDPNLLWWSRQVDITDLVISRLLESSR